MLECTVTEDLGLKWINVKGRIDAMTSPEIQQHMNDLILDGSRTLVINLEEVHYVSSAGLRVFLGAHKQLKKVGGEMILYKISDPVASVFKVSGLIAFFRVISSKNELGSTADEEGGSASIATKEIDGIAIQYLERKAEPGTLSVVGSQEPLSRAEYDQKDLVSVKPVERQFGTGLAALGNQYEEYKGLFGESVIIDGNFFFYPAVKRSAVDFVLRAEQEPGLEYRFFHGFVFKGSYKYVVAFESTGKFIPLNSLVKAMFEISSAKILGLVFMAESKGLWGMHLKKVPIRENKPQNGEEIFDESNFSDWINFPVEPSDINNMIVGSGIAFRKEDAEEARLSGLIPQGSDFHVHGGVFSREPLNKQIDQFEAELERVLKELDVYKVQHLLGQTCFSSGMIGIVELDGVRTN